MTEKWLILKKRVLSQVWFLSTVIFWEFLNITLAKFASTVVFRLLPQFMIKKWLSSDRRFNDSWPRKWVVIKSSFDTIIEQNV